MDKILWQKTNIGIVIIGAVFLMLINNSASAAIITTLDQVGRGWQINWNTGNSNGQSPTNNVFVGNNSNGYEYRNWFSYDLTGISGIVTEASFVARIANYSSPDPSETYELRHVSTPANLLGISDIDTWADLGDGDIFSSREIFPTDSDSNSVILITFELNSLALSEINSLVGTGAFAFGGSIASLDHPGTVEGIFAGSSGNTTSTTLVLTTSPVPLPPAIYLFMFGMATLVKFTKKRR